MRSRCQRVALTVCCGLALLVWACWPGARQLDGLRCNANGGCGADYVCVDGRCLRSWPVDAALSDAAHGDMATRDATAGDLTASDVGLDAGARDRMVDDAVGPDRVADAAAGRDRVADAAAGRDRAADAAILPDRVVADVKRDAATGDRVIADWYIPTRQPFDAAGLVACQENDNCCPEDRDHDQECAAEEEYCCPLVGADGSVCRVGCRNGDSCNVDAGEKCNSEHRCAVGGGDGEPCTSSADCRYNYLCQPFAWICREMCTQIGEICPETGKTCRVVFFKTLACAD